MRKLCFAALFLIFGDGVAAEPILYPQTGHFYDFIQAGGITWTEANSQAPTHDYLGHSAYLATISSQGENDFLYDTFNRRFWEGWLGGLQDINSAPRENWHSVTGEPWTFVNWAPGEPNTAGALAMSVIS